MKLQQADPVDREILDFALIKCCSEGHRSLSFSTGNTTQPLGLTLERSPGLGHIPPSFEGYIMGAFSERKTEMLRVLLTSASIKV